MGKRGTEGSNVRGEAMKTVSDTEVCQICEKARMFGTTQE
jgi:hypothetical protein